MLIDIPSLGIILPLEFLEIGRDIACKVVVAGLKKPFHCIFVAFTHYGKQHLLDVVGILKGLIMVLERLIHPGYLLRLCFEYFPNLAGTLQVTVIGNLSCLCNDATQILKILHDFLPGNILAEISQLSQERLPIHITQLG